MTVRGKRDNRRRRKEEQSNDSIASKTVYCLTITSVTIIHVVFVPPTKHLRCSLEYYRAASTYYAGG